MASVRVAAVRVAAVRVAAVRVAAVRVAAAGVAAVGVAGRLVSSRSQLLNYSIHWYKSSIQLESFEKDNCEITQKRPKTHQGESANRNRDQNCEPKREIPNPSTNPEGKKAQSQKWKV